jgi:cytochrome P450
MIGVLDSDAPIFRDWIYRNFQLAPRDNRIREQVTADMRAYCLKLLEAREAEPQDDLATLVAQAEMDGQPIDRELQFCYLLLLILAGIDTTWSAIASGLWPLASGLWPLALRESPLRPRSVEGRAPPRDEGGLPRVVRRLPRQSH